MGPATASLGEADPTHRFAETVAPSLSEAHQQSVVSMLRLGWLGSLKAMGPLKAPKSLASLGLLSSECFARTPASSEADSTASEALAGRGP